MNNNIPSGYKQTGVGIIPKDWDLKQLDEAAEVIMGQSPPGMSYNQTGHGIPLINGPTEFTDRHPIKIQWTVAPTKFCRNGDLLLCVRGSSTGRINISNDEYCIGRGIAAIRAKIGVDTQFITHQVDLAVKKILALTTGSTFPNIDGKSIRSISVPLPLLSEQQAIAEALSDTDALIESLEQLIAKKRQIKQGLMQELLTGKRRLSGFDKATIGYKQTELGVIPEDWCIVTIGEVSDIGRGRVINHKEIASANSMTYPVYSSQTSNNGVMGYIDTFDFEGEYITWTTDGANAGTVFHRKGRFNCTNVCGTIRLKSDDAVFVSKLLGRIAPQHVSRNLGNPKLMNDVMKNIKLFLPVDKTEQTAIAAILSDMDAEITALEVKLTKTRQIKQGMMHNLLTGKIRLV